ncbi:hypothetical protein SprV_0401389600 [Sparganum proliferum]
MSDFNACPTNETLLRDALSKLPFGSRSAQARTRTTGGHPSSCLSGAGVDLNADEHAGDNYTTEDRLRCHSHCRQISVPTDQRTCRIKAWRESYEEFPREWLFRYSLIKGPHRQRLQIRVNRGSHSQAESERGYNEYRATLIYSGNQRVSIFWNSCAIDDNVDDDDDDDDDEEEEEEEDDEDGSDVVM